MSGVAPAKSSLRAKAPREVVLRKEIKVSKASADKRETTIGTEGAKVSCPINADAQILVIDDEAAVVRFLTRALQSAGYEKPKGFTNPVEAAAYLASADPDLVVLDICMPGMDGYALLDELRRSRSKDAYLPVLAVSALSDFEAKERAVAAGAKDFLVKPVHVPEFLLHVYSLLDTRFANKRLQDIRQALEGLVNRRTHELEQAQVRTLERLGRVAEVRDDATGQHTDRVARLSALLAQQLHLSPGEVDLIMKAAPLHDLGKVAIADSILLKNGSFETEERELMQRHALLGAELLSGGESELMKMAEQIALSHHERWDGQGYPAGLAGENIPLPARIVAVADTFDALTHARPYKEAWTVGEALDEIRNESGWQFDPQVVEALIRVQRLERGTVLMGAEVPRLAEL